MQRLLFDGIYYVSQLVIEQARTEEAWKQAVHKHAVGKPWEVLKAKGIDRDVWKIEVTATEQMQPRKDWPTAVPIKWQTKVLMFYPEK